LNRTIEIVVSPQGKTQLETKGFAGSSCRQASQFLEQALGKTISAQVTPEFYARATGTQQQLQSDGST
jgi:hypothetical protein